MPSARRRWYSGVSARGKWSCRPRQSPLPGGSQVSVGCGAVVMWPPRWWLAGAASTAQVHHSAAWSAGTPALSCSSSSAVDDVSTSTVPSSRRPAALSGSTPRPAEAVGHRRVLGLPAAPVQVAADRGGELPPHQRQLGRQLVPGAGQGGPELLEARRHAGQRRWWGRRRRRRAAPPCWGSSGRRWRRRRRPARPRPAPRSRPGGRGPRGPRRRPRSGHGSRPAGPAAGRSRDDRSQMVPLITR